MELVNLFIICFGLFGFFALSEVVKLKKEVKITKEAKINTFLLRRRRCLKLNTCEFNTTYC